MYFEKIVKSLEAPEPRSYEPSFNVEPGRRVWHVKDGDTPVMDIYLPDTAMLGDRYSFDIFKFSPFQDPIICNHPDPECSVVDMHTLKNSQISFPYFDDGDIVEGVKNHHDHVKFEWVKDSGSELVIRILGDFPEAQRFVYEFRIDYDEKRTQYRFQFKADFWKLTPIGFEPINFLMAGALRGRKELNRWSHSIYEDRFHNLRKIVHSNALFLATDYSSPPYWRQKGIPFTGAWVGYGANDECNPVLLIHENNVPLRLDTCNLLFDEHIMFVEATNENLDENHFHFSIGAEFVNIPAEFASKMLEKAQSQPMPKKWINEKVPLPLYLDRSNDFETPLDVSMPEESPMILTERDENAPISWSTQEAYTGTHSIKLKGGSFADWIVAHPEGATCEVEPRSKYKLSARIKTKGVERFARVTLGIWEYTYSNPLIDHATSQGVSGDSDWTYVEAILDVGPAPYVMPFLQLYGKGECWFDDVKLEKI